MQRDGLSTPENRLATARHRPRIPTFERQVPVLLEETPAGLGYHQAFLACLTGPGSRTQVPILIPGEFRGLLRLNTAPHELVRSAAFRHSITGVLTVKVPADDCQFLVGARVR